ncbi:MAG: hypothetical protein ABEJ03_04035 [Candidatus Nanohaloarchaea archaeon]
MADFYEETERGSFKFESDKKGRQVTEAYREKFDLYSPNLGPHVDRLYRGKLAAPFGTKLAGRVGEIIDLESEGVKEEIELIIEE